MGQPSDFAELHAWATDQAAALVNHCAGVQSAVVLRELDTVRKAFETTARSMEAALTTPIQPSAEIAGFVERLTAHVGLDAIRTHLQESEAANHRLKASLKEAQDALAAAGGRWRRAGGGARPSRRDTRRSGADENGVRAYAQ